MLPASRCPSLTSLTPSCWQISMDALRQDFAALCDHYEDIDLSFEDFVALKDTELNDLFSEANVKMLHKAKFRRIHGEGKSLTSPASEAPEAPEDLDESDKPDKPNKPHKPPRRDKHKGPPTVSRSATVDDEHQPSDDLVSSALPSNESSDVNTLRSLRSTDSCEAGTLGEHYEHDDEFSQIEEGEEDEEEGESSSGQHIRQMTMQDFKGVLSEDDDDDDEDGDAEGADGPVDLEYKVLKWTKLGIKQNRIIVMQPSNQTFLLLTQERKSRKEYDIQSVTTVHIPSEKEDSEEHPLCTLSFDPKTKQRSFKVGFNDPFDRLHFVSELANLHQRVEVKDESPFMDEGQVLRFTITKVNKAGRKKKRILAVYTQKRSIKTYMHGARVKELLLKNVVKVERSWHKQKCVLLFKNRPPAGFTFEDSAQREKFLGRVTMLWDIETGDQRAITHMKRWGPYPAPAPAASSGSVDVPADEPDVTVFATSWNLGGSAPSKTDFKGWLGEPGAHHIYLVGFQECSKKRARWCSSVKRYCESKSGGEKYVAVATVRLWDMLLLILARTSVARLICHVESGTVACGIADMLGNKGAVAVSFTCRDTSFCVISSHFAARAERLSERQANYMRIVQHLQLGMRGFDILNQFRHVVWLGDFNYRIDHNFHEVCKMVEDKKWAELVQYDQLTNEKEANNVFWGFTEEKLDFPPTYRWDKKSMKVSNKREQPPSWTDRILCKSFLGAEGELKCLKYSASPEVLGSDHRPVWSVYSVVLRRPYMGTKLYHISRHNAEAYRHLKIQLSALKLRLLPGFVSKFTDLSVTLTSRILDSSVVFSAFLEYNAESEAWEIKKGDRAEVNMMNLRPFVSDEYFISKACILISINNSRTKATGEGETNDTEVAGTQSEDCLGCGVISLTNAKTTECDFMALINKDGLLGGQLSGKLQLIWEGSIESEIKIKVKALQDVKATQANHNVLMTDLNSAMKDLSSKDSDKALSSRRNSTKSPKNRNDDDDLSSAPLSSRSSRKARAKSFKS